jgi:hypothetical protein
VSWNWRGEAREIRKMVQESNEARKKYPRKDRQRLLRDDILLIAAEMADAGTQGVWGHYIMQRTGMSSGHVYTALAALERGDYLERVVTDKFPKIRYRITAKGRYHLQ